MIWFVTKRRVNGNNQLTSHDSRVKSLISSPSWLPEWDPVRLVPLWVHSVSSCISSKPRVLICSSSNSPYRWATQVFMKRYNSSTLYATTFEKILSLQANKQMESPQRYSPIFRYTKPIFRSQFIFTIRHHRCG